MKFCSHLNLKFVYFTILYIFFLQLYHSLIFTWGMEKEDFDTRWKSFGVIKNIIENKVNIKVYGTLLFF